MASPKWRSEGIKGESGHYRVHRLPGDDLHVPTLSRAIRGTSVSQAWTAGDRKGWWGIRAATVSPWFALKTARADEKATHSTWNGLALAETAVAVSKRADPIRGACWMSART